MLYTFEESTVSGKDSGATELKCTLLFCATVTGISLPFINQGQPKRANNLGIISNNISLWMLFQLEIINTRAGWLHLLRVCTDVAYNFLSIFLSFSFFFQKKYVVDFLFVVAFKSHLFLHILRLYFWVNLFLFLIKQINVMFLLSNKYQSQNVVLWLTNFKRGSSDWSTLLVELG